MRRQRNTEDEILVALESAHALATRRITRNKARRGGQLPHFNRLVEGARDEAATRGGEGDAVHAVFVAVLAFEADDELACVDVPDADALVEGAGGDVEVVRGNGDGRHAVFDGEVGDLAVGLEVPQAHAAVARARGDDAAVAGKVEAVDVLLVAGELVLDLARGNVPHADDLVLGARGQEAAVRAEAHAADVQVAVLGQAGVLQPVAT
ncbi:hypothetical protein OPT61_g10458 [Boeremia exigua]|uniref:Uncharacterized protein n=1 Tax=Boeremia exigua TaxID=749465 RepID=A0ACC2HPN6_9PLEO|nr:hypothetical protein OPT61_g10458 [Boeremia exigua]